ncbi:MULTISPECIES: DoxX family protein [Ralstonia]|jgi:putative oxidoreductase|uniref:Inner membrane protein YphA n=2 Tax=Ralstonia TaxID=48736 RepID=A0AAD2AJ72_9RALS|nr:MULTISPECIES: DoxX family protein [Ralstonia]MBY4718944.1 DoxX family protein [Ralstonia mannitolilytica]TXD61185.1 DoxX family protein [Ralstonia sp. TCR112]CAJ0680031.1 Inner membrane protein YphA [Ralstonia mannitolilytica]CAJ0696172.1 Inner membrane protein YphA [Ralstonia mannitolilytica]CAJ0698843.1 Inner membrane protein YphA [Ralstonia sp. LMG 6871]
MNPNLNAQLNANSAVPAVGRTLIAAIFFISGIGKLAAPAATMAYIASLGLPAPALGLIGALVLELAGATLLVVGYKTRLVALLLAVYAVVTALIFHHALGDQNQMFHFLKNLAMAGGLLQVAAFGAGAFSIDNRRAAVTRAAA